MKKIEAIIKSSSLEDVKSALGNAGVDAMTISEVSSTGRFNRRAGIFRGSEYAVEFLPQIKIELVLADHRLDGAVAAIKKGIKPARTGDERVLVSTVEDALNAERVEEHAF